MRDSAKKMGEIVGNDYKDAALSFWSASISAVGIMITAATSHSAKTTLLMRYGPNFALWADGLECIGWIRHLSTLRAVASASVSIINVYAAQCRYMRALKVIDHIYAAQLYGLSRNYYAVAASTSTLSAGAKFTGFSTTVAGGALMTICTVVALVAGLFGFLMKEIADEDALNIFDKWLHRTVYGRDGNEQFGLPDSVERDNAGEMIYKWREPENT